MVGVVGSRATWINWSSKWSVPVAGLWMMLIISGRNHDVRARPATHIRIRLASK